MEKRNFLFVSIDSLIGDIAWQVAKEGHNVKYSIDSPEEKEVADGFVPKVNDWRKEVDWADVIVFDDVLGQGKKAKKLRDQGHNVVGGTPYSDMLEDDRSFGQEEMKAHGIPIIPYKDFTSFEDATAFVKENPGRYVIKPSGEAQNVKRFLFVGEEDDGKDVMQVLEAYRKAAAKKIKVFQLQRRIAGVEVAVGAFFNGKKFIHPININFEHKKLFPGNIGPQTGEMGCYDDQTEVLTKAGWKMFSELGYDDEICTLNPSSHEIEFQMPQAIVCYNHHRELVSIKNQTLDVMVTPDHNMYAASQASARRGRPEFDFVKARDLEFQSVIKRTGTWVGVEEEFFVLPSVQLGHYSGRQVLLQESGELRIPMDDWLSFMGIWLSDGHESNGTVGIAQKKEEKTKAIEVLLERLPFRFSKRTGQFSAACKQLSSYLGAFGKAPEKSVPEFIKNLSPRQIGIFLDWFAMGDGTQMKGFRIFYTSSKTLAGDIQELLLKIGRVGVVKERQPRGKIWIKDHFANSSRVQYEVLERVKKLDSWIDRRDIQIVEYSGNVYCATVENHVMYVRRSGKPCWCGNTSMFWSGPNKLFNQTLKKFETKLRDEHYVGYIDLNCIVNGSGIFPLEFTSRFGYPTISIQQDSMITPIGSFLYDLSTGNATSFRGKSGFHVGVRIVVPPFPYRHKKTFDTHSKDAVIIFRKPNYDGIHIEDVKLANGEWLVTGVAGVALIVCGSGQTMMQAQKQVYGRIGNVILPNMYFRKDIGDRWYEDSDKLHNWGYLREV